ncbi:MutS-related protein [Dyadobacter psychrophilus]|uniref:MutS domain V n=1 Tax=Dyadobacter psychrophilus TaxID=651661 RepID=A0A1T5DHH4_9BACT|nr:DNA mismatch repair protein MutS [Dyadobacter psychrophilus]SKB71126.1 MutS domain V [Dyadobacter psychrophilus]
MPSKTLPEQEIQQRVKTGFFNFSQIEKYFVHDERKGVFQAISDRTFQDLDLEDVFKFIDRTVSCVGQQYLYYFMRTIPQDDTRKQRLENIITLFQKNPDLKTALTPEISKLNKKDAYYITSLFHGKYTERPSWYWLIKILSVISVLSVMLSFFFPQILIFLIILLPVNLGIHYWNKNNLYQYGSSIPQLLVLTQTAQKILKNSGFSAQNIGLQQRVDALDQLGLPMSIFKIEAKLQGEIGQFVDYVVELFKALFLIEPVLLFTILKILDSKRQHIEDIFQFVAETDIALSIIALRESVPHTCEPIIGLKRKFLHIKQVYHPLIFNGVCNDITLDEKSVLLTGSNMSGKTTFIRTVGINALLGQTINTCFAKEFAMSAMKIHSSIRISDDLLGDKSYYFEEVLTLKNLLEESQCGHSNLFLLDELFKGTNSVERIAIGKSVLSYLTRGNDLAIASTHDRELSDYLADTFDLYHFTEVIDEETIMFDYKLKPGKLRTTNAIRILELNDYPKEVVAEAVKLVDGMKSG